MISAAEKLYVFHDDDSSFVDLSQDAADFVRDNFSLTLTTADYLYIGYDKPISTVYTEIITPDSGSAGISGEYWDGTAWQPLAITDDTKDFSRSGYITWDKSLLDSTEINSQTAYWVRLSTTADSSAMSFRGINLIFADDADLKREFFEIDNANLLPPGEASHVVHHVAARNYIVQRLVNLDYIKYDANNTRVGMTYWDLHEITEIRQAAAFLALAKLFFNISDNPEDTWWAKYREYQDKFEESFKVARLSFDTDDDGLVDDDENLKIRKVTRWVR